MRHLKYLYLFLSLLSFLSSCSDENNNLGTGLVNSKFRNIQSDSTTILVSTVLIDSVETSGKSLILAGKYQHPLWGSVTSAGFIPYKCPSYNTDISKTVVLDSLVLRLSHSGYFIGDTTVVQQLSVHRLKEKIILNNNGYLYSNHRVEYFEKPLAVYKYKPSPTTAGRKHIEIRLPDELGQDLLTRLHKRDDNMTSDRFEGYFQGLAIIPDSGTSKAVSGYSVGDTLAVIDLHYHTRDEFETKQTVRFTPVAERQFNHFDYDRTGTLMETGADEYTSAELEGKGVLMGGVGWYARLEFPYLNEMQKQGRIVNVRKALLKIHPETKTYSPLNALPDSMFLFVADENHVVTDAVKDYLGKQVQSGKLVTDDGITGDTYYYFDITKFIQDELQASGRFKHNLQLMLNANDYTRTFRNLTFRDQQGKSPITLQLTYKIYESY